MQYSQIPAKFTIPFANGATGGFIRTIPAASQIGIAAGAASLTDGFPPITFAAIGSGGVPPSGQDFNGILNQITAWSRWQAAGALPQYDATFANAIGGYPYGALLASTTAGTIWINTADNNTSNPDAGGSTGWTAVGSALSTLTPSQLLTVIQSSGTYTIKSPRIKITAVGGGGGGNNTYGGGAGAELIGYLTGLTIGLTLNITVGAGGTGSASTSGSGTNGGNTIIASGTQSLSATLTAGGGMGVVSGSGNAGFGGTATNGQINAQGNGGGSGIGGIAQPFAPYGNGGGLAGNGVVINGTTLVNNSGAQGIITIEAVG